MEKLLAQAQALVASWQEANTAVYSRLSVLEADIAANDKLKSDLLKQKADLDAREKALKSREEPAKMLDEAKRIQAENREAIKSLDIARNVFSKEQGEYYAKASKDRIELDAAKDLVRVELEALKNDRKKLEIDRKNMKDDILNKLKAVK